MKARRATYEYERDHCLGTHFEGQAYILETDGSLGKFCLRRFWDQEEDKTKLQGWTMSADSFQVIVAGRVGISARLLTCTNLDWRQIVWLNKFRQLYSHRSLHC